MRFFKKIISPKDQPVKTYTDFWNWFRKNEKQFWKLVNERTHIERFLAQLSSKLNELKEGYFYLAGMMNDSTAELVITADGNTRNIVFVEELINAAPAIPGWHFTAHKQAHPMEHFNIEMGGLVFNTDTIRFYANELPAYPDEIDISFVHDQFTEENKQEVYNGVCIFLDHYLGELDFLNQIDNIQVTGRQEAGQPLIPVSKLKDYLNWRQKEFIEKYEGIGHSTKNDHYAVFSATLENGQPLSAIMNTDLLAWDAKASHPWIAALTIQYKAQPNGFPAKADDDIMNKLEDRITQELNEQEGYLNICRQTASGERHIYFACKDFRKPSKVFYAFQQEFAESFTILYSIYKDKYWRLFEQFNQQY